MQIFPRGGSFLPFCVLISVTVGKSQNPIQNHPRKGRSCGWRSTHPKCCSHELPQKSAEICGSHYYCTPQSQIRPYCLEVSLQYQVVTSIIKRRYQRVDKIVIIKFAKGRPDLLINQSCFFFRMNPSNHIIGEYSRLSFLWRPRQS